MAAPTSSTVDLAVSRDITSNMYRHPTPPTTSTMRMAQVMAICRITVTLRSAGWLFILRGIGAAGNPAPLDVACRSNAGAIDYYKNMASYRTRCRIAEIRVSGSCMRLAAATVMIAAVCIMLASCEQNALSELDAAEIRDNFPELPARELAIAAAMGNDKDIRKLVEGGVDVDSVGRDGQTPLVIATKFNRPASVIALLELGANPDHRVGSNRDSPVISAANLADSTILKLLLDRGADPDFGAAWRSAPIVSQADHGDLEAVRLLVEAGADVNSRGLNDDTALLSAARRAHYDVVLYLLEQGADHTLTNRSDDSLIHIIENHFYRNLNPDRDFRQETVELLRAKGVEIAPYE